MPPQMMEEYEEVAIIKEIDHTNELSDDIKLFFRNEDLSDITFNISGKSIPAHRMILGMRVDYFRSLLYGGLKESSSTSVELGDDTHLEAFQEILEYIYSGKISFRSDQSDDQIPSVQTYENRF